MRKLTLFFAAAFLGASPVFADSFSAPEKGQAGHWEAEKAVGAWQKTEDSRASGGAYAVRQGIGPSQVLITIKMAPLQ